MYTAPKYIVSVATIVLNNKGEIILLIKGPKEDGRFLAVMLNKEHYSGYHSE
ncbi:hypothetical protein [Neobacillus terrae]|uniref:hypothetical protein n=1 Tax=Neobacillus terrae TaxID=3034837 RepID=UPI003B75BA04